MPSQKPSDLSSLIVFDNFNIRRHYDEATETWYFAVVDIIAVLIEQSDHQKARKYWNKLSQRLKEEGSQSVTNCHRLKMQAKDGKFYLTDAANIETLLRIIQSVPSKKAEPVKLWLARVGNERIKEISDPSISIDRARENWKKHGRSEKWIQQRMMGQETQNKLTDYWNQHGVAQGEEFAILTNIIHEEWAGLSVKDHKKLKGLKSQNLRDHMSEAELIFTALAELSTRQIAESVQAEGLEGNKAPAKKGGRIARDARISLEQKTGSSAITGENFLPPAKSKRLPKGRK
jgi:hypothetical protein